MIFEILYYYENDLGLKSHIPWKKHWKFLSLLILIPLALMLLIFMFIKNFFLIIFLIAILALLTIIKTYLFLNDQYKIALLEKFNIESPNFWWNGHDYYVYRRKSFIDYLENEKEIDSTQKLEFLIKWTREHANNSKPSFYVIRIILASLLVPAWIEFIKWIYLDIRSIELAIMVLILVFLLIIFLIFLYLITSPIVGDLYNETYKKLNYLEDELNAIYITKI